MYQLASNVPGAVGTAQYSTATDVDAAAVAYGTASAVSQARSGHTNAADGQLYQLASSSPIEGTGHGEDRALVHTTYDEAGCGHIYQLAVSTPIDEMTPHMLSAAGDDGVGTADANGMTQAYDGAMNRRAYALARPGEPSAPTRTNSDAMYALASCTATTGVEVDASNEYAAADQVLHAHQAHYDGAVNRHVYTLAKPSGPSTPPDTRTDSTYALASSTPTEVDSVDAGDEYATVQKALHEHRAQYDDATGRQTYQLADATVFESSTDTGISRARAFDLTDFTQPNRPLRHGFVGAAVSRTVSSLSTASIVSAQSGLGNEASFVFANELRSASGAGTPTSRTTSNV